MMKTLKIILVLVGIVIAVGLAATWYLIGNLDAMVERTVEETGSKQLGTAVSLESVSVSLPQARATLKGLRVANPPGYSDQPVFTLGSIDVDIELTSIDDEVLVIENIEIVDPQVNFELNREGVSNLDVLQKSMEGGGAATGDQEQKRLIIDRLDFRGGTITARAAIRPDDQLVFDFPVVFMTGLGRPDGATAEEIGAKISALLVDRSMQAAQRAGVEQLVERQKEKLVEKAEEKLEEKLKDLLKRD
jgi:uncharacterized protein involved in outer membrane biogenesis